MKKAQCNIQYKELVAQCVEKIPVDLEFLNQQTMGDLALADELLALFAIQCETSKSRLQLQHDPFLLKELAHQLKGSAKSVGADDLAEMAALLENQPTDAGFIASLHEQINRVEIFLKSRACA